MDPYLNDTIVAISTPPGRGGIGVVRLSGPAAVAVAERLVKVSQPLEAVESHARARFARVLDPGSAHEPDSTHHPAHDDEAVVNGAPRSPITIDDAIVTVFFAPHSYTGETLVEIAAHGSPVILETIVRGALAQGEALDLPVRLAAPGEFTQRAFLSGRIDLTQAEAVHDLIAAQTLNQVRVAAQQLGGALSRRVAPAKELLLHLIALLEAGMDFASGELDDVEVVPPTQIAAAIESVRVPLQALAETFQRGQLMRHGASIALVGRPNAGKSSLFNRLLERDRAIVTPIPGTTRDTLEETISLDGIPLRVIDTAGLRYAGDAPGEGIDQVEALGIARTHEAFADADLVLHILDISAAISGPGVADTLSLNLAGRAHIVIHNKIDLLPEAPIASGVIRTSALTGAGIDELRGAILAQLNASGSVAETGVLNNLRQQQAVADTLTALAAAAAANHSALPHELILVDLHNALRALDSLTGVTTSDDILARIFSTFCIGK